jgi:carbon-monoxide dehydrogenase medium subunit
MYEFAYQKPTSLADAVKVLSADGEAKALAGGQTFIPVLKQRLNKPSVVVDLAKLGMVRISLSGDTLKIGAMTTHGAIATSPDIKRAFPALAHMASMIGDNQVRHRGTMGGSLAGDQPGR